MVVELAAAKKPVESLEVVEVSPTDFSAGWVGGLPARLSGMHSLRKAPQISGP